MADERDPKVSQRYRELGDEEPPPALDQKILAAADRGKERPHAPLVTPAGRHRWYYAFGAAAILVLAVAVTVQMERERPDAESAPAATPAEARKEQFEYKPPAAPPPVEQAGEPPAQVAKDAAPSVAPERSKPKPPPERSKPKPEPLPSERTPKAVPAPSVPAEARARDSDLASSRSEAASRPMQAPVAGAGVANQAQGETPERWIERIVQLRKEGRDEEAEKQLAEFRKRFPDYKIPEAALK